MRKPAVGPKPPKCERCGKVMQLKIVERNSKFKNLDVFKYDCACGHEVELIVRNE